MPALPASRDDPTAAMPRLCFCLPIKHRQQQKCTALRRVVAGLVHAGGDLPILLADRLTTRPNPAAPGADPSRLSFHGATLDRGIERGHVQLGATQPSRDGRPPFPTLKRTSSNDRLGSLAFNESPEGGQHDSGRWLPERVAAIETCRRPISPLMARPLGLPLLAPASRAMMQAIWCVTC